MCLNFKNPAYLYKKAALLILSIFFSFCLLCPTVSVADNNALFEAIQQNNITAVEKILKKQDIDLQKLDYIGLPSLEISELLLKNGLDPDKFLDMSFMEYCYKMNSFFKNEFDDTLIKNHYNLATWLLEKGAQPQKITDFKTLPSLKLSELLLKKGLDPSKFYYLVLKCGATYNYGENTYEDNNSNNSFSDALIKHKNILLGWALKQGADPKKVDDFSKAAFNAETTNFSKLETIKTWVATKYHSDKKMLENLQHYIVGLLPQNKNRYIKTSVFYPVPQDENVRFFGRAFPTDEAIELPFLQQINKISKTKKIITLEIGAAFGLVSWKVPLAFDNKGTHYVNELSTAAIKEFTTMTPHIFQKLQKPELMKSIEIIPGSCFEILTKHPELANQVDVILVQNVEHFLSPMQHQKFLALIETLLAPDGYAFLSANDPSYACVANKTGEFRKLILENEANNNEHDIYYAFIQYNESPDDYFNASIIKLPESYAIEPGDDDSGAHIRNLFTPKIYRQAITHGTNLEIIDTFFTDKMGLKLNHKNQYADYAGGNAAAIVKKSKISAPKLTHEEI